MLTVKSTCSDGVSAAEDGISCLLTATRLNANLLSSQASESDKRQLRGDTNKVLLGLGITGFSLPETHQDSFTAIIQSYLNGALDVLKENSNKNND